MAPGGFFFYSLPVGTRASRSLASLMLVAAASVATGVLARGHQKVYEPAAPAHRQWGPADAPIVIVEFSDLQCPGCAYSQGTLKGLKDLYPGKLKIIFKHFPLERRHFHAREAARAAECAGAQGKFWELHDQLFEHQREWEESTDAAWYRPYVKAAGVDADKLESCLKDPAVDAAITADVKEGDDMWVGSTPTFFVNGKRFAGGKQLQTLGTIWIDKQLRKKS
jgi:protein-disulfide isomerase